MPTKSRKQKAAKQPIKQRWKPGDIVLLKSGGPAMTVSSLFGENAHCLWFDGDESVAREGVFPADTLTLPL